MAAQKSSSPAKKRVRKQATVTVAPASAEPVLGASDAVPAGARIAANPVFAEPQFMPDPSVYKVPHASDTAVWAAGLGQVDLALWRKGKLPGSKRRMRTIRTGMAPGR